MKLPSLQYIVHSAKVAFLRFPATILSALVATCIGIYLIVFPEVSESQFFLINLLLAALLGIPLYFCVSIFAEKHRSKTRLIGTSWVSLALVATYFSLPYDKLQYVSDQPYVRYTIFVAVAHLLVAFVPYLRDKNLAGFWNYNKTLFFQFLFSLVSSGFLFVGISLALSALNMLFEWPIDEKAYFSCFVLTGVFFNTWFFVAKVDRDLNASAECKHPPLILKRFAQYILIPLIILYLIILYVYSIKVVISWVWPKDVMAYLIAGLAILGVSTHLLIFPYGGDTKHTWIKNFTRYYYYLLLPLIAVLFLAIGIRILDYGITINRYFIVFLGIWLTCICIYFSLGKTDIRFTLMSLAFALMLISFGPWGVFSVSRSSQESRLYRILTNSKIIIGGQVQHETRWRTENLPSLSPINPKINDALLSDSLHNEVQSVLVYLGNYHGFAGINSLLQQNIDSLITVAEKVSKDVNRPKIYMQSLGLSYRNSHGSDDDGKCIYSATMSPVVSTDDYAYLVQVAGGHDATPKHELMTFKTADHKYTILFADKSKTDLVLVSKGDSMKFGLDTLIRKLNFNKGLTKISQHIINSDSSVFITRSFAKLKMKFVLSSVKTRCPENSIVAIEGRLWMSEK